MDHKDFVREAIENYNRLPQETGELYKRYFINIPLDISTLGKDGSDENLDALKAAVLEGFDKLNTKFDVFLGSGGIASTTNEFVKIEDADYIIGARDVMHNSKDEKYVAYINAFLDKCVLIDIPDGKNAEIKMLMLNSSIPLNINIFVKLGDKAKLKIFEYYGSSATAHSVMGVIHDVRIGDSSEVEIDAIHNEDSKTIGISFMKNVIGTDSHLRFNALYTGAAHTRVRNIINADGKNSHIEANEVVFGSSDQKFDIGTYIINRGAHTNASLESNAALMDKSFCIMKGFAKIEKGATKAKSYVHERGILLDKGARVNGLPDMSVDENDVMATHSSATAPVDPESVFYLMSKGIDELGVRKLLVSGFFANSIGKMQSDLMRESSMSIINSKLETRLYGSVPNLGEKEMWIATDVNDSDMFKGHYKYR